MTEIGKIFNFFGERERKIGRNERKIGKEFKIYEDMK